MKQAQSYYSVIMHADFSIYQMRMLLTVVKRTRALTSAIINKQISSSFCTDGVHLNFAVPFKDLVGNSHNYDSFKQSIRKMMKEKPLVVERYDADNKIWQAAVLFDSVDLLEREGILKFSVNKWVVDYICDLRGGYRVYDFENAMSLRNPNAARLYLLCSSMSAPMTASFEELRKMLGLSEHYQRIGDFERRVLIPSAKELEDRGFNGFSYEIIRKFPSKKARAVGFRLMPIKREDRNISEVKHEVDKALPETLVAYLMTNCGFSMQEISANQKTFGEFVSLEGWQELFINIVDRTRRKRKNHGYLVNALKSEVRARTAKQ